MPSRHDDVLGLRSPASEAGVRRAGPADAEAAAAVQRRCWVALSHLTPPPDHAEVVESWRSGLSDAQLPAWVALSGATVVGVGLAGPVVAGEAELLALDVDPSHRRQGHASRLLAAITDHLVADGATLLQTWVLLDDEPRVRFLRSAGFAPDGARQVRSDDEGRQVRLTRLVTRLTDPPPSA